MHSSSNSSVGRPLLALASATLLALGLALGFPRSSRSVGDRTPLVFAEDRVGERLRRRLVVRPRGRVLWVHPDSKVLGGLTMRSVDSLLVYRHDGQWQLVELTGRGQIRRKATLRGRPMAPPALDRLGRILVSQHRYLECFTQTLRSRWLYRIYYSTLSATPPPVGPVNQLFTGTSSGGVLAIGSRGQKVWSLGLGSGPAHQPALDINGDLYVCTGKNGKQLVRLVRAKTGRSATIAWRRAVGPCEGRPLITPKGLVIVSTATGLIAFDRTGKRLWRRGLAGQGGPPVLGRGVLYVATTAGVLHAVSQAGKHLWTFPLGRSSTPPLPRIGPKGRIHVTSPLGHLLAISPAGRLIWHVALKNPSPRVAVRFDGAVAVVSKGHSVRLVTAPRKRL